MRICHIRVFFGFLPLVHHVVSELRQVRSVVSTWSEFRTATRGETSEKFLSPSWKRRGPGPSSDEDLAATLAALIVASVRFLECMFGVIHRHIVLLRIPHMPR